MTVKELVFFITYRKETAEFALQERNLLTLKLPKHRQKPEFPLCFLEINLKTIIIKEEN